MRIDNSPTHRRGLRLIKASRRKLIREYLHPLQLGLCALCGKSLDIENASIDHIRDVADFGPKERGINHIRNLQLTHPECNQYKSNPPRTRGGDG